MHSFFFFFWYHCHISVTRSINKRTIINLVTSADWKSALQMFWAGRSAGAPGQSPASLCSGSFSAARLKRGTLCTLKQTRLYRLGIVQYANTAQQRAAIAGDEQIAFTRQGCSVNYIKPCRQTARALPARLHQTGNRTSHPPSAGGNSEQLGRLG